MTLTVLPHEWDSKHLRHPSVLDRLALEWGVSVSGVKNRLYRDPNIVQLVRDVHRVYLAHGEHARLEALLLPLLSDLRQQPSVTFTMDLLLDAVRADAEEDIARDAWLARPSADRLADWKRTINAERGAKFEILCSEMMREP